MIAALTEEEKEIYQQRLASFLRDYRIRKNILAKEAATKIGVDKHEYSKLEHSSRPHKKFIQAIELLKVIASLDEEMTLSKFVHQIDGTYRHYLLLEKEGPELQPWEVEALSVLREMQESSRAVVLKLLARNKL
jgi:transcriptional regulator with XRE-family HTH domain